MTQMHLLLQQLSPKEARERKASQLLQFLPSSLRLEEALQVLQQHLLALQPTLEGTYTCLPYCLDITMISKDYILTF